MIDSASFQQSVEIMDQLAKILRAADALQSWDGHDQMMVRQLALMLYMATAPKTGAPVAAPGQLVMSMNNDFTSMVARFNAAKR